MKSLGVCAAVILTAAFVHWGWAGQPGNAPLSKREVIKLQSSTWNSLDKHTREVLAVRSKYVYKVSDELIIDAYDLMYWRERLKALLVRKSIQKYTNHVGYRTKETVGYEWEYRGDTEFDAYFTMPTYGAMYWYQGALVNDRAMWTDGAYAPLLGAAGVPDAGTQQRVDRIEGWISARLPKLVVVDPMSQADLDSPVYFQRSDGSVRLNRGAIGSALGRQQKLPTPIDGAIRDTPLDLALPLGQHSVRLPVIRGAKVHDGVPDDELDFYLLIPSAGPVGGASGPALGPASRTPRGTRQEPVHEIVTPRAYRVTAKELAVMWVSGELEIPYRVVEKRDGDWVCREHLLKRP